MSSLNITLGMNHLSAIILLLFIGVGCAYTYSDYKKNQGLDTDNYIEIMLYANLIIMSLILIFLVE